MGLKLAICTAILEPKTEIIDRCLQSWWDTSTLHDSEKETQIRINRPDNNLGVTGSLQWLYEHTKAPVVAFIHSDVEIFEPNWDRRILAEFDDPKVGVVGLGGALQLGEDELYRIPYRLQQLRRIDYRSNTRDAETHGERFAGECDVSTLDGFALIVRRGLLDKWRYLWIKEAFGYQVELIPNHGWPVELYPFHNYDNALCLQAHKLGYRVRLVGIDCQHHGGVTSTSPAGQAHWQAQGTTDAAIHEQSHLALYEDGRGILPLRVK